MEIQEFEQRLHDAEVRLARLKALYEQWFQGIERIEPSIARKELERALDTLKREQPRNTALRFRCQQLAARYGTYGIYWGRIAKQIEEGTYRRDLQRARARADREREREVKSFELDVDVDVDGFDAGLGDDGFGDSDLDAILGALTSEPSPTVGRAGAHSHTAPKTFAKPTAAAREPKTDPAPPPNAATQPAPAPGTASVMAPAIPKPALTPGAKPPGPKPPLPPGAKAPATVPAPQKSADDAEAPPSSSGLAIGRMVRPAAAATGGVREEAGTHSRSARPSPSAEPAQAAPRPAPPATFGKPVDRPPATFSKPVPNGPPTGQRPALPNGPPTGARPIPDGPPSRPIATAAPPRPPSAGAGPDVRALYDRYVEARRKNNERVDNVKLETLQQSIDKMLPKLREKHGNKAIDFDVVLQDGKVGLKPKVRP